MLSVGDSFHVLILPGILHLKDCGGQTGTSLHLQEKAKKRAAGSHRHRCYGLFLAGSERGPGETHDSEAQCQGNIVVRL